MRLLQRDVDGPGLAGKPSGVICIGWKGSQRAPFLLGRHAVLLAVRPEQRELSLTSGLCVTVAVADLGYPPEPFSLLHGCLPAAAQPRLIAELSCPSGLFHCDRKNHLRRTRLRPIFRRFQSRRLKSPILIPSSRSKTRCAIQSSWRCLPAAPFAVASRGSVAFHRVGAFSLFGPRPETSMATFRNAAGCAVLCR